MASKSAVRSLNWRDGLAGVATGTALAALNFFYFSEVSTFIRPGTPTRILFLSIAAALALAVWHRWYLGKPANRRGATSIPFAFPLLVSTTLYLIAALSITHQRSQPVPMNLGKELAGRTQVELPKGDPVADLSSALVSWQLTSNDAFDVDFRVYSARAGLEEDLGVMTLVAYRNSPQSDALADDFDDRITERMLSPADHVDAGYTLSGVPGHFRCGEDGSGKDKLVICAFAHGVSAAIVMVPATEKDPRDLARQVLLDVLDA